MISENCKETSFSDDLVTLDLVFLEEFNCSNEEESLLLPQTLLS